MSKINVLIVDDSVVIRRILSDELSKDPAINIVGVAANGRIALQKIEQQRPDAVTLDIEMPDMDGLATLKAIRETDHDLPVIMFSTLTERGGEATLDALAAGASDYVTKPANVGKVTEARQRVREDLTAKIKALCGRDELAEQAPPAAPSALSQVLPATGFKTRPETGTQRIDLVTIGVSTGGPNALAEVIPALPADFPVPIVLVQHMPPVFTRLLAERLSSKSPLEVREAQDGDAVKAGRVLIAPGDYHMELQRNGTQLVARLNQNPPENSCRPAVDVLFRSVNQIAGENALGVILTGMGKDGLAGCKLLHESGAPIYVQDKNTSVVWGMPGYVANEGIANRVLPLDQMAPEIVRRVNRESLRPGGTATA